MSKGAAGVQFGGSKGLASTFENAALEPGTSPLKFLFSLY